LSIVFYLFIALIALSVLVFFHELGHYVAARTFGVTVERFSIGFGKIISRKRCCGTEWAFSAIPLGGYVKMKGQDDANPLAKSNDHDSYNSKKPWQRIIILLAGPVANLILAFFVYLHIAFYGAPVAVALDYIDPVVGTVSENSPAQKAGLIPNDVILTINGHPIQYWYEIGQQIQASPDPIHLTIRRNAQEKTIELSTKIVEGQNVYLEKVQRRIIGIGPKADINATIDFAPSQMLFYAWNETKKATTLIAVGVKKMSTGEVSHKQVGGAITIFDIIMKFAEHGITYLLFIMALISVNLGVLNLLPIPALDGGHIMFNLYEIITRRAPSENALYYLTLLGWALLFGLMFLGLFNDINRIWGNG
jgi:regulator of sigma E protease